MKTHKIEGQKLANIAEETVEQLFGKPVHEATGMELLQGVVKGCLDHIYLEWNKQKKFTEKQAFYFSAEFLIGPMVFHNLQALGVLEEVQNLLKKKNANVEMLEELKDPATGNGGLGRLAACFLESAASIGTRLNGYGIKYKDGLFEQLIENGFQVEVSDDWKSSQYPWFLRRESERVQVQFHGQTVWAVPYDMPVIGWDGSTINTLRLWQSEPLSEFDFQKFNSGNWKGAVEEKNDAEMITRVLYPNDSTDEGKRLRLKQEYFFASASVQDIIRRLKAQHGDVHKLPQYVSMQLNDTHPVIAIPELIRLLWKEGMVFDEAFDVARQVFAYTNHTVMSEALEKWDEGMMQSLLPEIYQIIQRIHEKLQAELEEKSLNYPREKYKIIANGQVHMARLAIYGSSYINGVARIHTEILKSQVLAPWYQLYPEKFLNITNGVNERRWMLLANRELTELIESALDISLSGEFDQIERLAQHASNPELIKAFGGVKQRKKEELAQYAKHRSNIEIDPNSIFDIQCKRLHEYKRQLLGGLAIMHFYLEMKEGNLLDMPKTTFIFAGKAAPGYFHAKAIIKYLGEIGRLIEQDEQISRRMQLVFLPNYDVSYAQKIIPAADISEQISTAGTEASGTGNMKFMMNGAVTLGTLDGANIEIVEQAGKENNYIFGLTCGEAKQMLEHYSPRTVYEQNPKVKRVVDTLIDGTVDDGGTHMFCSLYDSLLHQDSYLVLADIHSYVHTKKRAIYDCMNQQAFYQKCIINIAKSGKFTSDRSVREYDKKIWHLSKSQHKEI